MQKSKSYVRGSSKRKYACQNTSKNERLEKESTESSKSRYYSKSIGRVFAKEIDSDSQANTGTDTDEKSTNDYALINQDNYFKDPLKPWIAHTAALNMTDYKNLFRSLNSIPKSASRNVRFFAKDTLYAKIRGKSALRGEKCEQMNFKGAHDAKKKYFHRKNDSAFNILETSEVRILNSTTRLDLTSSVLLPRFLKKDNPTTNEEPNNITNDENGDLFKQDQK
ncbi:hypothetical protein GcM3_216036 [Golovinomyces cichoracearum]|uniref:Uncharacterized protein n=1 Tax=Golovinomyces cichoracearum TaxID=62708 RepID=A0A420H8D5_9PEZI|nr:hypothetical protein GcM3_216036 [Golovinomyces cichoracearum]